MAFAGEPPTPTPTIDYFHRGTSYGKLGEHQQAIQDFDKSILLDFDHSLAYNNRGTVYYELGQYA